MNVKNNIIFALDVFDINKGMEICEKISDRINTVKIGYPLTLAEGMGAIKTIKDSFDCNIICDYKVADIPATNSKICEQTFNAGADAVICHGFVGKDSVEACMDKANEYGKEVFLLTEMSHPGAKMFLQDNADEIAEMGVEMGIKNYVAPATRINRLKEIREIVGNDAYIISPGVGKQGGDVKETLQYADSAIIGRSIYEAEDPIKAIDEFLELI